MNQLTEQEIEIMNLFTSGLSDIEISKKLKISTKDTKIFVSNIYQKLDSKNKYKQTSCT